MPGVTSDGLKWTCNGDFVARQCLQFRGVMPVCADASIGRPDGAILHAALEVVSGQCQKPAPHPRRLLRACPARAAC